MIDSILYQRQWAETVRLYSGLLEKVEREAFILSLSEKNILLAAECKSIVAEKEAVLEEKLTELAIENARNFNQPTISANGFLALAELDKLNEISNIFTSVKVFSGIHGEVVMNFLNIGNELQISTFLEILSKVNKKLFIRALNRIVELNIHFSMSSLKTANILFKKYVEKGNLYIVGILICAFKSKFNYRQPEKLIHVLLDKKQVKHANLLSEIFRFQPQNISKLTNYLDEYVLSNSSEKTIMDLIDTLNNWGCKFTSEEKALSFSKHLNVRLKTKFFKNFDNINYEVLLKIIDSNLELNYVSTINFALNIVEEYNLFRLYPKAFFVRVLLSKLSYGRLVLALELIDKYELDYIFPYELMYIYSLNIKNINEGSILAIRIIRKCTGNKRKKFLHILALLEAKKSKKILRRIVFEELNNIYNEEDIKKNIAYYGYVSNIYKGNYSIFYGDKISPVIFPKEKSWLKLGIIKFNILNTSKIDNENIQILSKNISDGLNKEFILGGYFIYQILDVTIKEINKVNLVVSLNSDEEKYIGIIDKSEINMFVNKLENRFKSNDKIKAVVIGFNRKSNKVYLSQRRLEYYRLDDNQYFSSLSIRELNDKISFLKEKLNE